MSIEEDNLELRDLVAQTLEANGVISKIKAQLRASVFLALDEDEKISNQKPLLNKKVNTYLNTDEGKAMFCIVHEFLEFCDLKFTLSVYEPESYLETKIQLEERQGIVEKLGVECDGTRPILLHLLQSAKAKSKSIEINLNMGAKVDHNKSTAEDISDSIIKTMAVSDSDMIENKSLEVMTVLDEQKLNATFDVSSSTVNISKHHEKRQNLNICDETSEYQNNTDIFDKESKNEEYTYEDTGYSLNEPVSSISYINDIDKTPEINFSGTDDIFMKGKITGISKISPKADELKTKNGSNSMTDLPPLQLNKSCVNDILPSLYSKEFKEKSNLRELDKLFEMEAEYEEDFIFDADDLTSNSERSKVNLLDEIQNANRNGSNNKLIELMKHDKQKSPNKQISENKMISKHCGVKQKSTDSRNSEANPE